MSGGNEKRPPLTDAERITQLEEVVAGLILRIDSRPPAPPVRNHPHPVLMIELTGEEGVAEVVVPQNRKMAHDMLEALRQAVEKMHGSASGLLLPGR